MKSTHPLLSIADVAVLANVSERTVRRWMAKGLLKPIHIKAPGNKRGVIRFREKDIEFVLRGGHLDDHDAD
jgi:DNA-binding transcriptional MerR regulator